MVMIIIVEYQLFLSRADTLLGMESYGLPVIGH